MRGNIIKPVNGKKSRGRTKPRLFIGEAVDDLLFGELKLIQKKSGYRYSADALLISEFVLPRVKSGHQVIDIGCGSGVIGLILAKRSKAGLVLGVEIQKSLAGMARRNVALNQLGPKIKIIESDAKKLPELFKPRSFDIVVSNPPFIKTGAGFLSKSRERSIARNELEITMPELAGVCGYLLKPKGRLCLIYPFARLLELVEVLEKSGLHPARLRLVFHKQGEPLPILFCMEIQKVKKPLALDPPCYIESEKGRFFVGRDR